MGKWGTVRVLNVLVAEVKDAVQNDGRFSSVSDFATHALRKELERMEDVDHA